MVTIFEVALILLGYVVYRSHQFGPLVPLSMILLALILFCRLTVEMNDEFVAVRFGPGVIRKKWRLAEIKSCAPVRNRWWHGWGIRWIGRRTWLFNISGWDAVELRVKDGRIVRIGTDEPTKLSELIQGKLTKAAA
jgi:hypothetical protein